VSKYLVGLLVIAGTACAANTEHPVGFEVRLLAVYGNEGMQILFNTRN